MFCGAALAGPTDDLRDAENSYLYGDYPRVVAKLTPLVEPDIRLADPENVARAYELLGLAHSFLNKPEPARKFFAKLIRFRPDKRLNPMLVPPTTIAFFDQIRAELEQEIAKERAALRKAREEEAARRKAASTTKLLVETRRNSRLVAAMPFGLGQFQNDDPIMGATFLGTEVLAAGLSFGFFAAVEQLRQPSGRFQPQDKSQAETLQQAQLISGGVALALMVAGVIHAQITFEEQSTTSTTVISPGQNGPTGLIWEF